MGKEDQREERTRDIAERCIGIPPTNIAAGVSQPVDYVWPPAVDYLNQIPRFHDNPVIYYSVDVSSIRHYYYVKISKIA